MVYLKFHAEQSFSMFTRNTKTLLSYVPIAHKPILRLNDGGGACTLGGPLAPVIIMDFSENGAGMIFQKCRKYFDQNLRKQLKLNGYSSTLKIDVASYKCRANIVGGVLNYQ